MDPRTIIQNTLDYIETHLENDLTPDGLCRTADYFGCAL